MELRQLNQSLGNYVIATSVLVTLFVSPWNSIDPVNLPKMTLLGVLASISLSLAILNKSFLIRQSSRPLVILLTLFSVQLTIVLLASNLDFSFKFFGTPSRNTGFLAYMSLGFLLFASAVSASHELLKKYAVAIVALGGFLSTYGLLQWRGIDFFDYVNAYGSDVFGTFGNPNFQSAFMGITAAVAMTWVLFSRIQLKWKITLGAVSTSAIANVALSSQQGGLNFLAGLTGAVIIYLFSNKKRVFGWSFLGAAGAISLLLLLGILNIGPLASVIYKSSLQAREFYWRAAIKMMVDHPFLGVGLDGFGDWYRRSRTQAVAEFNSGIVADTAHNIPLDIGSSGGFPLMFIYFALIGLVVISIIKVLRRNQGFDVVFASIVAAWAAYQAQSLISINQLGLGVWGWSLSGLLIGYELNTRGDIVEEPNKNIGKKVKVKETMPASALLVAFVAGGIGMAISLPPYIAANKYYKALQSGDGVQVQKAAYLMPYDRTRFLYSAQILTNNKLDDQAIQILKDASKIYPDSFDLWSAWAQIPSADPKDVARAKAEMKRLDPFNPDLK